MERALRCTRFQPSGPPQKRGLGCACFLRLPRPSGSGSQGLAGRTLPGCGAPSPLRGPSLSFHPRLSGARARRVPAPCVSPRPSRRVWTIQNLRRSLNRDWRPACSAVGARSSGPSLPLSSTPCLQSPRGWAGPQPAGSSLHLLGPFVLRTAESVFGLVNFLSLFCCPTV